MKLALVLVAACGGGSVGPAPTPVSRAAETGDIERSVDVGGAHFVFRAGRMTNFLEQLDCLADLVACSKAAFNATWKLDDADRKALAAWHDVRTHYSGQIEAGISPDAEPALPLAYHPRDIEAALRAAGFGARDTADYLSRLSVFAANSDVEVARTVLARFEPRATESWLAHRTELIASLDGYIALAQTDANRALSASVAQFYTVDPRTTHQTFELVWRPVHKSPTSAQQLGELAVVEATSGEPATDQWPVVAHEMFHAWFSGAPIGKQAALVDSFVASKDPIAQPAYAILDEVLATAFGNGLVGRAVDREEYDKELARPQGFYNDLYIDGVAKALLPALEKRLAAHGTVFDADFVAEYLAAAHAAIKSWPPIAFLRPLNFMYEPALKSSSDHLRELVGANYSDGGDLSPEVIAQIAKHPGWGTALLVTREHLDDLLLLVAKPQLAAIKQQKAVSFVYAQHRTPIGALFVFVAPDDAAMHALVDQFAKAPEWRDVLTSP